MEFNERDTQNIPSRGYPVYKLLRAVNRQYPNNGFINYVDVRDDMYDTDDESTNKIIDEDLRDLINETLQETYINVARDEVYSFPTVPGQREYSLPEDCDLRDIQEVTRTFGTRGCPPPPPPDGGFEAFIVFDNNGGEGYMETIKANKGDTIIVPECTFVPPEGKTFKYWKDEQGNIYNPGDEFVVDENNTLKAIWGRTPRPVWVHVVTIRNAVNDENYITVNVVDDGVTTTHDLYYNETYDLYTGTATETLGDNYDAVNVTFNGSVLLTLDMTQVYTENTTLNVTHPVVPPDPETPGDNGDDSSIDDPVDPIDDGNGGYGDNPLNGGE